MSLYTDYLKEIENRKNQGLSPKPIDDASLLNEIISNIKDKGNKHRTASVDFFIYNVLPGTTKVHPLSLHAGRPVTGGEKYAFNLWFRENKFV